MGVGRPKRSGAVAPGPTLIDAEILARVETWRKAQPEPVTLKTAFERLLDRGLKQTAGALIALGLFAAPAHGQSVCMSYVPQLPNGGFMNGALTLCPLPGKSDLGLTAEQQRYFQARADAIVALMARQQDECQAMDYACQARIAREVPKPTPEALQFLARYGITEEQAQ